MRKPARLAALPALEACSVRMLLALAVLLLTASPDRAQRPASSVPKAPLQPDPLSGAVPKSLFLTAEQKRILSHLSLVDLPDGNGGTVKAIRVTGINVQIVNGLGATNGNPLDPNAMAPFTVNGAGNLIVGYDELAASPSGDHVGSHHLVVGQNHVYTRFGGLVNSKGSRVTMAFGSISGGHQNLVYPVGGGPDYGASVSGGLLNTARAPGASVSGGSRNIPSAFYSSVSGGTGAYTGFQAPFAAASGGRDQILWEERTSISGGFDNQASRPGASVSGGRNNYAGTFCFYYPYACTGSYSSIAGGELNFTGGTGGSIAGGRDNATYADDSSVSGGHLNFVGVFDQESIGYAGSVAGGEYNGATGVGSAVSGGQSRTASGEVDWVGGSLFEDD